MGGLLCQSIPSARNLAESATRIPFRAPVASMALVGAAGRTTMAPGSRVRSLDAVLVKKAATSEHF